MSFLVIKDIPLDLLVSVAECYRDMQLVCRICFFESKGTALVTMKEKTEKTTRCNCDHVPWRPIKVIPRSPLCASATKYIPLPPLPNHMKQSSTPFVACKKNDHKSCYVMSIGTNPWFPHTVEELVIWTVERETGELSVCLFRLYLCLSVCLPAYIYLCLCNCLCLYLCMSISISLYVSPLSLSVCLSVTLLDHHKRLIQVVFFFSI